MNCEINYLRNFWDYSSWRFKLLNPLGANPTKTPTSSFISITVIKLKVFHVFLIKFARAKINIFFFTSYLAAPRPTLGHYRGGSLTKLMLITPLAYQFRPESHRYPRRENGSQSPADQLVPFELGSF